MRNLIIALLFSVGLTAQTFDFTCVTCNTASDLIVEPLIGHGTVEPSSITGYPEVSTTRGTNLGLIFYFTESGDAPTGGVFITKIVETRTNDEVLNWTSEGFENPTWDPRTSTYVRGSRTYTVYSDVNCTDGTTTEVIAGYFTIYWE